MTISKLTSNESFAILIQKRNSFQARMRSFGNYLTKFESNLTLTDNDKDELELRLSKLGTLFTDFNEVQSHIESICDNSDEHYLERKRFHDTFYHAIEQARSYLAEPMPLARSTSVGSQLESVVNGNELGNNASYTACNSLVARPTDEKLHSMKISSNALDNDPPFNRGLFTNCAAHSRRSCIVCKGDHAIYNCTDFLKEPANRRRKIAAKMKICLNCLRVGHHVNMCKHSSCRLCKKRHNTLLHTPPQRHETRPGDEVEQMKQMASHEHETRPCDGKASARTSRRYETRPCVPEEKKPFKQVSATVRTSEKALLSTAMVTLFDKHNNSHSVRALLDCGSTSSFLTEKLAKVLQPLLTAACTTVTGINNRLTTSFSKCTLRMKAQNGSYETSIDCNLIPHITSTNIKQAFIKGLEIPKDIKLADPEQFPNDIDLLIGADLFWDLIKPGKIHLSNGQVKLQETKLGWILVGKITTIDDRQMEISSTAVETQEELNQFHTKCSQEIHKCQLYTDHHLPTTMTTK